MLENIKATYFIKLLFEYVDERQKLKVVKFNKSLQNIINISISNYKFFLQKYTIKESNGIRKEYYGRNDLLLYEGEYLNGKRNGKGKEYYNNGKLKFEGEYLNHKEHIGIKYDKNGMEKNMTMKEILPVNLIMAVEKEKNLMKLEM